MTFYHLGYLADHIQNFWILVLKAMLSLSNIFEGGYQQWITHFYSICNYKFKWIVQRAAAPKQVKNSLFYCYTQVARISWKPAAGTAILRSVGTKWKCDKLSSLSDKIYHLPLSAGLFFKKKLWFILSDPYWEIYKFP